MKYYLHFPTNATCWSQATDEVYDLARTSREFLDEYDDVKVEAVDFATLDTPAKRNSVCREAIWRNYDLMRRTPNYCSTATLRRDMVQKISK